MVISHSMESIGAILVPLFATATVQVRHVSIVWCCVQYLETELAPYPCTLETSIMNLSFIHIHSNDSYYLYLLQWNIYCISSQVLHSIYHITCLFLLKKAVCTHNIRRLLMPSLSIVQNYLTWSNIACLSNSPPWSKITRALFQTSWLWTTKWRVSGFN